MCRTEGDPSCFSKLDIKDGYYWRMVIPEDDEWHFVYVLPPVSPDDDIYLVIPSSLQFCAASEIARNVSEDLAAAPVGSLPAHPLEGMLLHPAEWPEATIEHETAKFLHLVEVYVDNFIQLAQTTDPGKLKHLAGAILHRIHSVFPPRAITGHAGEDPVSIKKLKQGDGLWATRKELVGWIFDGAKQCIELPLDKVERMTSEGALGSGGRNSNRSTDAYGMHTSVSQQERALWGPSTQHSTGNNDGSAYAKMRPLGRLSPTSAPSSGCLLDQRPTHGRELVVDMPGFVGFCDASKLGAGGVWLAGTLHLLPVVWRDWSTPRISNTRLYPSPTQLVH